MAALTGRQAVTGGSAQSLSLSLSLSGSTTRRRPRVTVDCRLSTVDLQAGGPIPRDALRGGDARQTPHLLWEPKPLLI